MKNARLLKRAALTCLALTISASLNALTVYVINDLQENVSILVTPFTLPNYQFPGATLEQPVKKQNRLEILSKNIKDPFRYEITFRNTDAQVIVQNTPVNAPWYRAFTDGITRDPKALHVQFWTQTSSNLAQTALGTIDSNPSTIFVSDQFIVTCAYFKDLTQNKTIFITIRPAKNVQDLFELKKELDRVTGTASQVRPS